MKTGLIKAKVYKDFRFCLILFKAMQELKSKEM